MADLVVLADVKAYLFPGETITQWDTILGVIISAVSVAVQREVGCDIIHTHYTSEKVSGRGKSNLDLAHFPITAVSYVPLYSAFREVNLLKWRIRTDVELYRFTMLVDGVLEAAGIHSIYPQGWVSSLVTALEDIPELCYDRQELNQNLQLVKEPFPRHLFTANEIALSRVKGPEKYEILERIVFR